MHLIEASVCYEENEFRAEEEVSETFSTECGVAFCGAKTLTSRKKDENRLKKFKI